MSNKRLFDKKCVFCMWDDALRSKEVFVADSIEDLMKFVEKGKEKHGVIESTSLDYPFLERTGSPSYRFCYYDPLYDVKKAYYKEGKTIQYWEEGWKDFKYEPMWSNNSVSYRIKPIEGGV